MHKLTIAVNLLMAIENEEGTKRCFQILITFCSKFWKEKTDGVYLNLWINSCQRDLILREPPLGELSSDLRRRIHGTTAGFAKQKPTNINNIRQRIAV